MKYNWHRTTNTIIMIHYLILHKLEEPSEILSNGTKIAMIRWSRYDRIIWIFTYRKSIWEERTCPSRRKTIHLQYTTWTIACSALSNKKRMTRTKPCNSKCFLNHQNPNIHNHDNNLWWNQSRLYINNFECKTLESHKSWLILNAFLWFFDNTVCTDECHHKILNWIW